MKKAILVCIVFGLMGSAYLFGYVTHKRDMFPSQHIQNIATRLRDFVKGKQTDGVASPIQWSALIPLRRDEMEIPVARSGSGGGMTSVGDDLLLLTHEGSIFEVSGKTPKRTNITPPSNHFAEYKEMAESKYQHLDHIFETFRYNDIAYYSYGDRAGLVISYTEWQPDRECYGTTVAQAAVPSAENSVPDLEASIGRWEVIFRTKPCLPLKSMFRALEGYMAGGRLAFMSPNKILLTSGDYYWDGIRAPEALAQETDNDYGKIIELDVETGHHRHVSIGNRNPQGILVDNRGTIWSVEHGPRGGDELNRIEYGKNYGWPLATLGTRYNRLPIPSAQQFGRHDFFEAPVFAWVPSIGISNIAQINKFHPSWDGDLLIGSLKASSLFRLRVAKDRVIFAEPLEVGERIRYVHQHSDGRIGLWTDANKLVFLRSIEADLSSDLVIDGVINGLRLKERREERLRSALADCTQCHSLEFGDNADAPSLAGIFERPIASSGFERYSVALRDKEGIWTAEELSRFLHDPERYAPGTSMPNSGLSEEIVNDMVFFIERLTDVE